MDPDRQQRIEELCQSTLSLEPASRAVFLNEACQGDDRLRAEVEAILDGSEQAAARLLPGARLGQYRISARLGAGGMGVVYQATDTTLRREVAIKVLPNHLAQHPDQLNRFRREAQMLAALNHPNIATLYGLEHSGNIHYLAMELVPGETLAEMIDRGPVPLFTVISLACQVAEALEAAHLVGMTHRDIKPANIKVTPEGRVKVLDFGLARIPARSRPLQNGVDESTATAGLTVEGQILGTPAYMSPEQVRGLPADHRSDIWAVGCVVYEMLSGRRAFLGATITDTLAKVLEREPDWKALPISTPLQVSDLLKRCLNKDPAQRPESIAVVRSVLAAVHDRRLMLTRRHLVVTASLGAILAGSFAAYWAGRRTPPARSIAILPFTNVSGDPRVDYLSLGISESLIGSLARTPELKVVARDSAIRYAGRDKTPREIGRELGVALILRGRLLQRGEMLSVGAELVAAQDGAVLWSDQWERPSSNLLQIEQDIARQLRLKLAVNQQAAGSTPTGNPEAFRLYLQGRYFWNTRTEVNLRKSAESFQQAIENDPNYSLAWAGLADAFLMLGAWSVLAPDDAYPRARAAAARAISMDGSLAEPHATLGYLKTLYEWDWLGADAEFRRAIELQPKYSTAHHWHAFYYQTIGDFPASISAIERAREFDPLSPVINSECGYFYSFARRYDRALLEARKTVEMEPASVYARIQLAKAYALLKRPGEAKAEIEKILAVPVTGVVPLALLAVDYGLLEEPGKARGLLDQVQEQSRTRYVGPALIALAYASIGDSDHAFEYFDRAVADRSLVASWLRAPEMDKLKADPRYGALLGRLGLKLLR